MADIGGHSLAIDNKSEVKKKKVFNSVTKQRLLWLVPFCNNCVQKRFLPGTRNCCVSSTCLCDSYHYYHLHCSSSQAHQNVSPWLGGTMIFFIPAGCLTCAESFLALVLIAFLSSHWGHPFPSGSPSVWSVLQSPTMLVCPSTEPYPVHQHLS